MSISHTEKTTHKKSYFFNFEKPKFEIPAYPRVGLSREIIEKLAVRDKKTYVQLSAELAP